MSCGATPSNRRRDDRDWNDRWRDERPRDRYRYASGDPYFDRGYERPRDVDRDLRFRDREYGRDSWNDYPWNRYDR